MLSKPPRALALAELSLEIRSINALGARFGQLPLKPEDWASVSVGALMRVPGFGAKSLVDFLCAYEAFCNRDPLSAEQSTSTAFACGDRDYLVRWATDPACRASRHLLNLQLPALPNDWEMRARSLQNRTANALCRNDLDRNPESLSGITVGALLALPGFGERSAKDLVAIMLDASSPTVPAVLPPSATLDDELRQLLIHSLPRADQRTIAVALRYLGLDGCGGGTLREVAQSFGISRERVRQIVERATSAVGNRNWDAPMLSRVLSAMAQKLPRRARDVEGELREQGLIAGSISLDNVARVADLVGHVRTWGIANVAGEAVVVPAHQGQQSRQPARAWHRQSLDRDGAASRV